MFNEEIFFLYHTTNKFRMTKSENITWAGDIDRLINTIFS